MWPGQSGIKEGMNMKKNVLFVASLLAASVLTGCAPAVYSSSFANDLKVTEVELDVTYYKASEAGEQFTITPTIHYRDDKEVKVGQKWISSNEKVATVDNGVVTTLMGGHCNISFIAGMKMASCYVQVPKDDAPTPGGDTPVTPGEFQISLDKEELTLKPTETYTLRATTSEAAEVIWTSTNEAVATVSNGVVSALSEGTTTIVASANGKYARCEVTVSDEEFDPGQPQDEDMTVKVYFFIDYNNVDDEDTTGKKLLSFFWWYEDRPIAESGKVPPTPSVAPDKAFPYFAGWSDHSLVDSKSQLIDLSTYVIGSRSYIYIYGIWTDNQGGLLG